MEKLELPTDPLNGKPKASGRSTAAGKRANAPERKCASPALIPIGSAIDSVAALSLLLLILLLTLSLQMSLLLGAGVVGIAIVVIVAVGVVIVVAVAVECYSF